MDPDAAELRVLGCLIEKQRPPPAVSPLSGKPLPLPCTQATTRDPVVDYDEPTIREALDRLSRRRWARLASGAGSRAVKYRHLFDDALGLSAGQLSVLAVLMLRGPQTPGELRTRSERLYPFASFEELHETLSELMARELVARQQRRPGQKEERYAHLLGGDSPAIAPAPAPDSLDARVARLEEQIAELLDALDAR